MGNGVIGKALLIPQNVVYIVEALFTWKINYTYKGSIISTIRVSANNV